jgi:hypothetical protein
MAGSKKFHINPQTGEVGPCRATTNCPFGDLESEHYDSKEEARGAYEKTMSNQLVVDESLDAETLSTSQLNNLAKTTQSNKILNTIVTKGSNRTLANLAKNPRCSADVLALARDRAQDPKIKSALIRHPNFETAYMTDNEFVEVVKSYPYYDPNKNRLLQSSRANDSISRELDAPGYSQALLQNKNNLSPERISELAESDPSLMNSALVSGRYPLADRADKVDLAVFEGSWTGFSRSTDAKGINALAARAAREGNLRISQNLVRSPALSNDGLDQLADSMINSGQVDSGLAISMYKHPNANPQVQEKLSANSPTVKSYDKLAKLDNQYGGNLEQMIGSGQEQRPTGYSSKERIVHFNPDEVKRLGLDSRDIDTYVRYRKGNHLYGASFDTASGTYRGYID